MIYESWGEISPYYWRGRDFGELFFQFLFEFSSRWEQWAVDVCKGVERSSLPECGHRGMQESVLEVVVKRCPWEAAYDAIDFCLAESFEDLREIFDGIVKQAGIGESFFHDGCHVGVIFDSEEACAAVNVFQNLCGEDSCSGAVFYDYRCGRKVGAGDHLLCQ